MLNKGIRLDSKILHKHFSEEETYGLVLGHRDRNFVCIDFDYQREQTREQYDKLVKFSCSLFQCPKILITSSTSENRHCYLFFRKEDPFVVRDRIVNVLKKENINPNPGFVEVITHTNLRLPFGKGSNIIDINNFQPVNLTKTEEIQIFLDYLLRKDLPSIYQATPSYVFMKDNFSYLTDQEHLEELQSIMKNGIPGEGHRNRCLMLQAINYAKNGYSEEEIESLLIEYMEQHGDYSKDYRKNPERVKKNCMEQAVWAIKRQLYFSNTKTTQVDDWFCDIIFKHFFKFNYRTQKSVFALFKFVKANLLNKRYTIPMSREFKYKILGLNSKNYKQVFFELEELDLLRLKSKGDNLRRKPNFYTWIGPDLSDSSGYLNFFDFLYKNQYNTKYSRYIQKKIEEDRKKCLTLIIK